MRKALLICTLAGLIALLVGATAPGALAQDSGIDQYTENPGTVPESGGGGGGGGGSGGGGGGSGGGGSAPAPSGPSVGSAPTGTVEQPATASGTTVEQPATASGTTTTESTDTTAGSGDGKSKDKKKKGSEKKKGSADEKSKEKVADPVLSRAKSSAVQDSGSSGLGIALPLILGVLLLGAGVVAALRIRRAKTGAA